MIPTPSQSSARRPRKSGGFTLVELMVSATLGALVLAAAASIIVMTTRTVYKNTMVDDAVSTTRKVQEHLNKEISVSVSQSTPIKIQPVFSNPSSTTPVRYATITYRVTIGSFSTVYTATDKSSSSIVLNSPADVQPAIGDYLMIDSPLLGSAGPPIVGGALITAVDDHRSSGSAGTITLTLADSIDNSTYGTSHIDIDAGTIASIQRERKYETVDGGSAAVTELHWYSSTASGTPYQVLSTNVDSTDRYLFAQVPDDPNALEPSVSWRFRFLSSETNRYLPGSKPSYYQANYAEGLLMPKSGNPLNVSSYAGITTSTSTTTTTSTSTSTSTTTSTSTSTTSTTSSSTSISTTTSTTSSISTTTSSSSTTSVATTTTSTSVTTTTSTTSTSTTSISTTTTSTTSTSSTSISTSSTSSTSTSSSVTTTSTSTSSTSSSVSTTSTSSTSSTTSISTTTTSSSTSSSTSISTTTTTTSIVFDG